MSGVAYNSWSDLIPNYPEEAPAAAPEKVEDVEELVEDVDDEERAAKELVALSKRLRLVRKKLRQIAELEAAQAKGVELDDDQQEKLSKKSALQAEHDQIAKKVEVNKKDDAGQSLHDIPAQEPEPEETVQQVQELIAKSMESGAELETQNEEPAEVLEEATEAADQPAELPEEQPEETKEQTGLAATSVQEQNASQAETAGDEALAQALAQEEESAAEAAQPKKADADGWMVQKAGGKVVPEKAKKKKQQTAQGEKGTEAQATHAVPSSNDGSTKTAASTKPQPAPAAAGKKPAAPAPMTEKDKEKERRKAALGKVKKGFLAASFSQRTVEAHRSAVSSIKIFKDRVLTSGFDNTMCEWDLRSGALLRTYGGHTNSVRSVIGDEQGIHYSGGDDSMVRFWEASSGKLLRSLYCYAPVRCVTVAEGVLYTGHSDCTVRAYSAEVSGSASPIFTLRGHAAALTSVACYATPEGRRLLCTDEGGSVVVWDVEERKKLHECCHPEGDKARRAVWQREEGRVVSAHDRGSLLVWEEPYTGQPKEMGASSEEGGRGCMHLDGSTLIHAHALDDGAGALAFYLWATREVLYTVTPVDMEVACSLDVDGDRVVVGGVDGWLTILTPVPAGSKPSAELQVAPLLAPDKAKAARGQLPSQRAAAEGAGGKGKKKKAKAKEALVAEAHKATSSLWPLVAGAAVLAVVLVAVLVVMQTAGPAEL